MKKVFAFLLSFSLLIGCLAGCGKGSSGGNEADGKKDIKVGFIFLHDENSTYDKNFIDAAKVATKNLGLSEEQVIFKTNIPESNECYEAAADLVDRGCDIVFADSFGHEPYMAQAAEKFPEVQFCHATGTTAHTAGTENLHNAFASIYEGRYLAGIAAGMKLRGCLHLCRSDLRLHLLLPGRALRLPFRDHGCSVHRQLVR